MTHSGPSDRYDSGRRRGPWRTSRWTAVVLGAIVVLLGLGIAYIGYDRFGAKDIDSQSLSYDAVNESTMNVHFSVTRQDPSRPAECIIRARSKNGLETGRREVLIAPSSVATVDINSVVRTSAPPALGDVYGCSFDIPKYLKAD